MASKIIQCKTCGAEIAKNAKVCPSCGAKNKRGKKKWVFLIIILLIVVVFFAAVMGGGDSTTYDSATVTNEQGVTLSMKEYQEKCETVAYKDIARNPAAFEGKMVKFKGQVVQAQESSYSKSVFRIDVTKDEYDFWTDTVYVTFKMEENGPKILEDDIVEFYGVCQGTTSYTSIFGEQITIPAVDAAYMNVIEE